MITFFRGALPPEPPVRGVTSLHPAIFSVTLTRNSRSPKTVAENAQKEYRMAATSFGTRLHNAFTHQRSLFGKWRRREKLMPSPINCGTLGPDDAAIARQWLARPNTWQDATPARLYAHALAHYVGLEYAFALQGGRAALHACVAGLELKEGDEVIVQGLTCLCVTNAFEFSGIKVVFADIELDSYGMDAEACAALIGPRTKAIVLQHMYGYIARDTLKLHQLATTHGLWFIEDCAHSLGARYMGKASGTFGDVAVFSSERSKIINTIHGGIVATSNPEIATRLARHMEGLNAPDNTRIRSELNTLLWAWYKHAHPWRWISGDVADIMLGHDLVPQMSEAELAARYCPVYDQSLAPPLGAIGLNQLAKIEYLAQQRRAGAAHWQAWCVEKGYTPIVPIAGSQPAHLRYPLMVEPQRKVDTTWGPRELGVEVGVWFTSHVHPSPRPVENCPNAAKAAACCVNLPTLLL